MHEMFKEMIEDIEKETDVLSTVKKMVGLLKIMERERTSARVEISYDQAALEIGITEALEDLGGKIDKIHTSIFGNGSLEKSLCYKIAMLEKIAKVAMGICIFVGTGIGAWLIAKILELI